MKNLLISFFSFFVFAIIFSCSSTKVVNSFVDPSAKTALQSANKIIVASLLKSDGASRTVETAISQSIGSKAFPAYSVMDDLTKDNAQNYLQSNHYDVAIVSRLVSVDQNLDYVPGNYNTYPSYYGGFYSYWGMAYANYYDPGYYQTSKSYKVETNVYDINKNKLIYSAITDTYDPSSFNSGMSDIIDAIKKDLQKNGIIN